MKFSWIVVFGLAALAAALGFHALNLYVEAEARSSEVSSVSGRLAQLTSRADALEQENGTRQLHVAYLTL